ncbi:hypothetical protein [Rossellomorea sp. DA94]|uniref:hypothetical protein n=1 Tax=Rossellomorea sp. DA94 TaxID=3038653 RepID=UPI00244D1EC9|nr:hypothetical protein [Rossellomorea sp. DA94]WGG46470.1 hypothetical protein P8596_04375 [Rossellomorea sp. DA94]
MNVKKGYHLLKKLYEYGEVEYHDSISFLKGQYLFDQKHERYIITNNWITYGQQFQSEQDHILSLFCFNENYQKYLVEVALLTALKMRETEYLEDIETFVSSLLKLSSYAVSVLSEIKEDSGFSTARLESRLKQNEEQYQNLNRFIFDGPPHYQRVMFYLKHVQAYKQEKVIEDIDLGKKIDDQWKKGRKISNGLSLVPLKERPLYTLVPSIPERKIDQPQFQHVFTYPWKLFVFLCCIVRENFEAQGLQAIRYQVAGDGVDVLLTASNHQEFRYGSFDEFATEFCKVSQYLLFPNELCNLHTIFHNLVERKLLTVVDEEYRLPTTIEDVIYHTRLFIPLIAESKQLRERLEQWVDELREKR